MTVDCIMGLKTPLASATRRAVIPDNHGDLTQTNDLPIPECRSNEVLIRTQAVALNPADWKYIALSRVPGGVCGCSAAGIVIEVGSEEGKNIHVGDRVACMTPGAFAEVITAVKDLCFKLPDSMAFEDAAPLGTGLITAGLIFWELKLDLQALETGDYLSLNQTVLVSGGATSTGTLTIQLLKRCGYQVIATCSPQSFSLVQSAGATAWFDYNSPSCRQQIWEFTNGNLSLVVDCVGSSKSTTLSYGSIGKNGGRFTTLDQFPDRLYARRKDVSPSWVLAWTALGVKDEVYEKDITLAEQQFARRWAKYMDLLLSRGEISPHPIQVQGHGFNGIRSSLDQLRRGKVSGRKLIHTIG